MARQQQQGTGPNGEAAKRHPLWSIWRSMRYRCNYQRHKSYRLYGGAGVKVCARWASSFWAFVEDVGHRPSNKHSLDRWPDKAGDYAPGNVRWATQTEQLRNQARNTLLTLNGETRCISEWAEVKGIGSSVIRVRINRLGWTIERALSTPVRHTSRA